MAYTCKYGNLKTPYRKGRTVRLCKRKKKTKKCSKRVCKYGKLKVSKKGRCCKRKPKSLQISESVHNNITRLIQLSRKYKSLKKKMASVQQSMNNEQNQTKKLEKAIKLAKYTKDEDKLNKSMASTQQKLDEKLAKFASKGPVQATLVQKAKLEMNKKIDSL